MISNLHLLNFKCFEDLTINFKPLTVLTGLNSTGKSSILQSLLLLRQSHWESSFITPVQFPSPPKSIINARGSLMLNGDLVNIGTVTDAMFEGAKNDEVGIDIVFEHRNKAKNSGKWRFGSDQATNELTIIGSSYGFYETALFKNNFHYLQAERIGPRLFFNVSNLQGLFRRINLGIKGEYTAYSLSVLGNEMRILPGLAHPNEQSLTLTRQVEAWLSEISPGVRLTLNANTNLDLVELRYSSQFGNIPNDSKDATLPSRDFRSTNVGFGITYVLPVIVAVLSSSSDSLLLIENPEAHLHPRGQAQIGTLLALAASCGIQVVIETHSDHILNGIRLAVHDGRIAPEDAQLHFFRRQEQSGAIDVISPRIDRDGRISEWPEGFFDEWERHLMALLEPRSE